MQFVDTALKLVVRCPAEIHKAPEVDDNITQKFPEVVRS